MNEIKSYSLSAILTRVKNIIDEKTAGKSFWLKAEISNITFQKSSRHCYVELVETKNNTVIAQCKATIWASTLSSIRNELKSDFDNILKKGNEFLCLAKISFTQLYGLQINILRVDVSFNLGNLEKIKQETIERLKREGIFDANKLKKPPEVIKRIALITSTSTAAYADFHKQVIQNKYGYKFEIVDIHATVQGDNAVGEICQRLESLNSHRFDIVAIIRGGGTQLDLDVFNNYTLAKSIATHNLPVYTGIGHETDFSVADMVASMSHKTPTALGAYIVEQAHNFDVKVNNTWTAIKELQNLYFETQKNWLYLNIQTLTSESVSKTRLKRGELHTVQTRINTEVMDKISKERGKLIVAKEFISSKPLYIISFQKQSLEKTMPMITTLALNQCDVRQKQISYIMDLAKSYHPRNIMKKGYAIPRYRGMVYKNQPLKPKEELEIELLNKTLLVSFIKSKEHGKYYL